MFNRMITLPLLLLPSVIFAEEIPSTLKISVFSTHNYPIQHSSLAHAIYQLDDVEQWEDQFSYTFSKNPEQAEQQAKALFQTAETQNKLIELQKRYKGVIYGWQNGIRKVPAVLFDSQQFGKSVVYGVSDIKQAIVLWENWSRQQKQGE